MELRQITKRFGDLVAVNRVNLDLQGGQVHALLGENGAGKTTLMNVLSGLLRPDEGEIFFHERRVAIHSPKHAFRLGIGMVHQHFRLVSKFTAAENLYLGWEHAPFVLSPRELERRMADLAKRFKLEVKPSAPLWQLSVGEQQRVAILRTLARGAEVLILDEPTSVLSPPETRQLFLMLRTLAKENKTIVFISHKLEEVMDVSDQITVLRSGRKVATLPTSDCNPRMLAQMMVGRPVLFQLEREKAKAERPVLVARGVSALDDRGLPALQDIDLTIHAGEIVGIAGVSGNGQRELSEVLTGLRRISSGRINIGGVDLSAAHPLDFIRAGVSHIPEDRYGTGMVVSESVERNAILKAFREPPIGRGPLLSLAAARGFALNLVKAISLSIADTTMPVQHLSGGNIQRLLTARELWTAPKVLVAVHPTRGLDVGATEEVRVALLRARSENTGVLLISEDLSEVLSLSDRILVLYRGRIVGEFSSDHFDAEEIGLLMAGVTKVEKSPGGLR